MILKYKHLSDESLLNQTKIAAKTEQQMTLALLDYLFEVERRKIFATLSYRSLFQYVVQELGYSTSQASERINAMRLVSHQPEVRMEIEEGALTLTSAAQIQRFIQVEKKAGMEVTSLKTENLIEECKGKSTREVDRILLNEASDPGKMILKEQVRVLPKNRTELKFSVDQETEEKIKKVKNLIGDISLEDLFNRALEALTQQEEKKRGVTRAPARVKRSDSFSSIRLRSRTQSEKVKSRFIPIEFKRKIFERSGGQCEYFHPQTNRRCDSRYRLQIDHIVPVAFNGKTELQNLRHYCFHHNIRAVMEAGLIKFKR